MATEKTCNDKKCAKHGTIKVRGRILNGIVVSTKAQKTVIVEFERRMYVRKYERYERRRTKIKAHNPPCIDAKEGDIVQIQECRPLSKFKSFIITKVVGKEELFAELEARREEAKVPKKKTEEEKPKIVTVPAEERE